MHPKRVHLLLAVIVIDTMLLAACAPATAPQAPAAPATTQAPAAPAATQAPAAPAAAAPTATPGVVAIQKAEQTQAELEGEIVISIQSSDVQTYQALADAYMKLHPKVKVLVELRPPGGEDSYLQWVRTQFAAGTPHVSLIENPHFLDSDPGGPHPQLGSLHEQGQPLHGQEVGG